MPSEEDNWRGYEWTALSVTTVGALLGGFEDEEFLRFPRDQWFTTAPTQVDSVEPSFERM